MQEQSKSPELAYRSMLTIWAGLLMSQFMFFVLIYFVKPEMFKFDISKPILGGSPPVVLALAFISIVTLLAGFLIRKRLIQRSVTVQSVGLLMTGLIVGCSLSEVSSLFGILLTFALDYSYFYIFIFAGIIGILLNFPSRSDVQAASFKDQL